VWDPVCAVVDRGAKSCAFSIGESIPELAGECLIDSLVQKAAEMNSVRLSAVLT
jgi:hypothetical protein